MHMNATGAGWRDARRLAGRSFAQATTLEHSAEHLFGAFHANRANLLMRIDQLQHELAGWREIVTASEAEPDQPHPLLTALEKAAQGRLNGRRKRCLKIGIRRPAGNSPSPRASFGRCFLAT